MNFNKPFTAPPPPPPAPPITPDNASSNIVKPNVPPLPSTSELHYIAGIKYPSLNSSLSADRALTLLIRAHSAEKSLKFFYAKLSRPNPGECFLMVRLGSSDDFRPPDGYVWNAPEMGTWKHGKYSVEVTRYLSHPVKLKDEAESQMVRLEYRLSSLPGNRITFVHYLPNSEEVSLNSVLTSRGNIPNEALASPQPTFVDNSKRNIPIPSLPVRPPVISSAVSPAIQNPALRFSTATRPHTINEPIARVDPSFEDGRDLTIQSWNNGANISASANLRARARNAIVERISDIERMPKFIDLAPSNESISKIQKLIEDTRNDVAGLQKEIESLRDQRMKRIDHDASFLNSLQHSKDSVDCVHALQLWGESNFSGKKFRVVIDEDQPIKEPLYKTR